MNPRVLVLGAGQLGLMLAEAGARLGVVVDRYDPERELLLPGTSDLGLVLDAEALLARYALITTEREHLPDTATTQRLLQRCSAARAMAVLPDRALQKQLLDRLGLATAPWQPLAGPADLAAARARWGAVVVKARHGGYDGRGTWLLDTDSAVPALPAAAIVEARVPFLRELSLVAARNGSGEMCFYPLVHNQHEAGILRLTLAPAADLADTQQHTAQAMAAALMEALDYRGVLAVELFETETGLLINEVAPRVHNSGHWTQDGASIGQFELHLRALLDLPLPAPQAQGPAAMLNLIGVPFEREWLQRPGQLHWYNKTVRPGRKQGHVNFCAPAMPLLAAQMDAWHDLYPALLSAGSPNRQTRASAHY